MTHYTDVVIYTQLRCLSEIKNQQSCFRSNQGLKTISNSAEKPEILQILRGQVTSYSWSIKHERHCGFWTNTRRLRATCALVGHVVA